MPDRLAVAGQRGGVVGVKLRERLDLDRAFRRQTATPRPPTSAKLRNTPPLTTWASSAPRTSAREAQPSSNGSNAPSSRGGGSGAAPAAAGEVDQPAGQLAQLAGDRAQAGARIAQRQARPSARDRGRSAGPCPAR